MANQVGQIEYTVSVDTKAQLKAEAEIDKSLKNIVNDFDKADKAVIAYMATQKQLGNTVNKLGQVFDKNGNLLVENSREYRKLANAAQNYHNKAMQQTKVAKSVSAGMKQMQRSAQNFGYQIQDIAVQLAGGQNPFLVMSQQLPQLAVGMGAVASIAGALVAVFGVLAMQMFKNKDTTTQVKDALESLKNVMEDTKDGSMGLTDAFKQLADQNKALANAALISQQIQLQQALKNTGSATMEAIKEAQQWTTVGDDIASASKTLGQLQFMSGTTVDSFDELTKTAFRFRNALPDDGSYNRIGGVEAAISSVSQEFGISRENALKFLSAVASFQETKTPEALSTLATTTAAIGVQSDKVTKKFVDFNKTLQQDAQDADNAERGLKNVKVALDSLSGSDGGASAFSASKDMVLQLTQQLKVAKTELTDGKLAADLLAAAFSLNLKNAEQLPPEIRKLITELRQVETTTGLEKINDTLSEQMIKLTMTTDEYEKYAQAKAIAQAGGSDEDIIRLQKELELVQKIRAENQQKEDNKKITQQVETIASGVDPLTQLQTQRDKQLALVAEYEQQETANHEIAVAARKAIDDEYEANKMAAAEAYFVAQSEGNELLMESINSLSSTTSNVLTGMLTQTMSLRDAMSGVANAILNEAVNALVQMGLQYVKNQILGNAMAASQKANIISTAATSQAASTAAASTSAANAATVAAASAPAAAATATWSFGAAAAAAAVALIGTFALTKMLSSGGRQFGGGVIGSSMYRVGENGPEIFQSNSGQNFMIPGENGKVLSNGDSTAAMGGGGGIEVNIYTSQTVEKTNMRTDSITGKQYLDLWCSDFAAGGKTYKQVITQTTAKGKVLS